MAILPVPGNGVAHGFRRWSASGQCRERAELRTILLRVWLADTRLRAFFARVWLLSFRPFECEWPRKAFDCRVFLELPFPAIRDCGEQYA